MIDTKRQQWISQFLTLVDTGAPAVDYRRRLGISIGKLHHHVAAIGSYREELAALNAQAKKEALEALAPKPVPTAQEELINKKKETKSGKETNS